jgi:alpha-tubulin suppressor-like RCC1 family protein
VPFVFISYSHEDRQYVAGLVRRLTSAGLEVWHDDRVDSNKPWPRQLENKIEECGVFVPVMSPRSRESQWVDKEIRYAQRTGKHIKPLLLQGNPFLRLEGPEPPEDVRGKVLPSAAFISELRQLTGAARQGQSTVNVVSWGSQNRVKPGLADVAVVAAGQTHSLAVHHDGRVSTWGRTSSEHDRRVDTFFDIVDAAAGFDFSVVLHRDGHLTAWGDDLGGRATSPPIDGVVDIAAGQAHGLALLRGGVVKAWGLNTEGQTDVPRFGTQVVAIAAGGAHSLALRRDGRVQAWGSNSDGQATVPEGLACVVAIAAGEAHSLVLQADGRVQAWGRDHGEKEAVEVLRNVTAVAAGFDYSVVVHEDGRVTAWGARHAQPVPAPFDLHEVVAVAAGNSHCLAIVRA